MVLFTANCLFSLWLLLLFVLIDVTKILALDGTMQYKVHKWYIKRMNGWIPYELDVRGKSVWKKFVSMTVRKCFKMAVSEYLCFTKRLQFVSVIISFKGCASTQKIYNYLIIKPFSFWYFSKIVRNRTIHFTISDNLPKWNISKKTFWL